MISPAPTLRPRPSSGRLRRDLAGWLIMLPGLILFAFFVWEPLLESVRLSFYQSQGMRTVQFIGLGNYAAIVRHPDFWPAVRNTFMYTFWSLAIGFLVPIIMAVCINEMVHAKSIFRLSVYLPNIVPGLATVFLWKYLFRSDANGALNMLLGGLGMKPLAWLSSPQMVIPIIVLTMTWKGAGATMLIYLAGLQGINQELYEAAIIDGASVSQRLWHITVPNIYNLARTLLILQVIAVFQILYEPLVMTNGGPNNASISLMQLMFRFAFDGSTYDYAKASAVAVMIAIALISLTLLYNKLNKPKDM